MAAPASTLFSTGGATDGAISGAIGVVLGRRHSCRQALCWSDALRVGAVTPAAPAVLPSLAAVRGRSEHSSSQACSCHVLLCHLLLCHVSRGLKGVSLAESSGGGVGSDGPSRSRCRLSDGRWRSRRLILSSSFASSCAFTCSSRRLARR